MPESLVSLVFESLNVCFYPCYYSDEQGYKDSRFLKVKSDKNKQIGA